MLNPQSQFNQQTTELIKLNLNKINDSDEQINQYIHSEEFLTLSIDSVIKSMNILLSEQADYLMLSFVLPEKHKINAKELYSFHHLAVHSTENIKSALINHLEYIEAEKVDVILHHYIFYNDKRKNIVFLKPSNFRKSFPLYSYKNVA